MSLAPVAGVLVGLLLSGWRVQSPGEHSMMLSAARFYRATGGQTLTDVFCRVPFRMLDTLSRGPDGVAAYRISISVRDSTGLALFAQSWSRTVSAAMLGLPRASTVEHFAFAGRPGVYAIGVTVTDSASGRVARAEERVAAFAKQPGASDLLLATAIRRPTGPADSAPRAGEVRKGSWFLEASGQPILTPQRANLGYYLEAYTQRPDTASVAVRVKTAAGAVLVETEAPRVQLEVAGGATGGVIDLGGLPPGQYRLEVVLTTRDSELVRSAAFGMTGFETEAVVMAVGRSTTARDATGALTEAQLDSLYEPLTYIMTSDEHGVYSSLTVDGKRRFLRQFWARRDSTPGTPRNETQEDFYARIAQANQRFREGGAAAVPGWRTDRGRIFTRYGAPDEVLSRPQAGSTLPYEAWKYTRVRWRKFVFVDLTRFGHYALVWTNERREPSRPDWRDLLGEEAAQDVDRF